MCSGRSPHGECELKSLSLTTAQTTPRGTAWKRGNTTRRFPLSWKTLWKNDGKKRTATGKCRRFSMCTRGYLSSLSFFSSSTCACSASICACIICRLVGRRFILILVGYCAKTFSAKSIKNATNICSKVRKTSSCGSTNITPLYVGIVSGEFI